MDPHVPRTVRVGGIDIANNQPFVLIAGPCQIESRSHALDIAHALRGISERVEFRGRHYALEDAPGLPKPVQKPRPPLIVGGSGKRGTV